MSIASRFAPWSVLLIVLGAWTAQAQSPTFRGQVTDSKSRQPVPFATVSLWRADSVLLTGTTTDEAGAFTLVGTNQTPAYVQVQLLGYQTARQSLAVPAGQSVISLPQIGLTPNEVVLKEVVVRGQQATQTVGLDKQTFSTKQFQNTAGGTGLDLLKRLPAITVNTEGALNLRGSENVLVLINGKPTTRTAADVLAQLAANQIEQVEISTSPSARYDSDGKAGIINIITKQDVGQGWGLTLNGLVGGAEPPRYGADATLTYTAKRWSTYVAGDYRRYDIDGYRVGVVRTLHQDTLTYLPSAGVRNWQDWQYGFRAGATLTPNTRSVLNLGYYGGYKRTDRIANLHYVDYVRSSPPLNLYGMTSGEPLRRFYNQNLFSRTGSFQTLNADYTRNFMDKSKLTLLGLYEYSVLGGPLRNSDQVEGTELVTLKERSDERSPLTAWRAQLDWTKPLSGGQRLEAGYQWRRVDYQGDFHFERLNLATGQWATDPAFADQLRLTQQVHGGYVQWARDGKRVSYQTGLRLETTDRSLSHQAGTEPYTYKAVNLFPSAQALWKLSATQTLRVGYNRRMDRPMAKALSPFRNHRHAEAIELGDPSLRPELSDVVEAAYSQSWQRLALSVTAYLNRTQDRVFRVNAPYSRITLLRVYTNAGQATSVGSEFSLDYKPLPWWRFYASGNLYRLSIVGSYLGLPVDQQSVNYNLNANTTLELGKKLRFQYDISYVSRTVTAQGVDSDLLLSNAGLKYTLGNTTAGLQLTNVFNTNAQTLTTQGPTFYSATEYRKYDRVLQLTVGLRLNDTNKKLKTAKTDYGEKDF